MSHIDYDVLIIGAGMVGATLAAALGRAGFHVALMDRGPPPPPFSGDAYGLRVSAVNRASQQILANVDAWSSLQSWRVSPYQRMEVWDAGSSGRIRFDCAEVGEPCLGHIVENDLLTRALHDQLQGQTNITLHYETQAQEIKPYRQTIAVVLEDGGRLRARLLVGADGSRSWVRRAMAISAHAVSYQQRAIVTEVATERPHEQTAWQRFLPTGPVAFLPLANGHCSIVWSCDESLVPELLELPETKFQARLGGALAWQLGTVELAGPRAAFPLTRAHADSYLADRCVLVGDAAHTVHPLAGQGVNLGLADAAVLAQVVEEANRQGRDIGSLRVLRCYERWRKGDNLFMMGAMDGLQKLFGRRDAGLRWLRGMGLSATDHLPPLKRQLVLHAMGLRGDLPALAQAPVTSPA